MRVKYQACSIYQMPGLLVCLLGGYMTDFVGLPGLKSKIGQHTEY